VGCVFLAKQTIDGKICKILRIFLEMQTFQVKLSAQYRREYPLRFLLRPEWENFHKKISLILKTEEGL